MSRGLAIRGILSNNNDENKEIKRVIRRIFIIVMMKTKIKICVKLYARYFMEVFIYNEENI